eukprot:1505816-Prymnesium_polylepis.1
MALMGARADAGRSDLDATEALTGSDLRMAVPLVLQKVVVLLGPICFMQIDQDDGQCLTYMEQQLSEIICGTDSDPAGQPTHAYEADAELAWSIGCWGGQLAGDFSRCDAFDASRSSPHFKHKLCVACQQNGVSVPVDRVRAIEPSEH